MYPSHALNFFFFKSPEVPSWERRKTMLQDACRGVAYLHAESPPLVHQDIKRYNYRHACSVSLLFSS